ncbi:recombinase family protein [Paenibacillus alvei]|uniref:recombinase family protein n=1 Tax=Paenibacillus alvei TaxID=44250 RepID=UPI0022828F3E|nr:recombinase family protein [Paenibacillus alvei]
MRCAIYVRVSTNKEEQKTSLENQRALFLQYVSEKGWSIYDFYVEIQSGTKSKRPELQRLIADAKAKKFDMVMAKELSRLARNGRLSHEIRDTVLQKNIHIITLDNAINSLEGNTDNFGLYAWIYERESQNTSNRLKTIFKVNAQRGKFKGSIPPLGYRAENGQLYVRNDPTPDIVRRIFRNYLNGKGYDAIARELNDEGIPTPSQIAKKNNCSNTWQGSTVRLILTNQNYVGDLVQGKSTTKSVTLDSRNYLDPKDFIIVPNQHDALITRSEFEAVQQLVASRYRKKPQPEIHLFTNTAFCADCGRGMHYKKNSKGYVCGNYNKPGKNGRIKCSDHLVREADLKLAIIEDIRTLASNLSNATIYKKLENQLQKINRQNEKQISTIESEIDKLKTRKRKARDKNLDGNMTDEEYNEYVSETNVRLNELIEKKCNIEESLKNNNNTLAFTELKQLLEEFLSFKELTPEILHRLIDRIEIKADGSPRIFYRFSNPSAYSLLLTINAQHSTCVVCGNMSTGCTSTTR